MDIYLSCSYVFTAMKEKYFYSVVSKNCSYSVIAIKEGESGSESKVGMREIRENCRDKFDEFSPSFQFYFDCRLCLPLLVKTSS